MFTRKSRVGYTDYRNEKTKQRVTTHTQNCENPKTPPKNTFISNPAALIQQNKENMYKDQNKFNLIWL